MSNYRHAYSLMNIVGPGQKVLLRPNLWDVERFTMKFVNREFTYLVQ
jgi:hypothetical protein